MACSADNIIQWNCRGLRTSREDVEILLNQYCPVAFCIQETKLKKENESYQTFRNYNCFYSSTETGSGGVGLLIKSSYLHRAIPIDTDLQAIAVSITIGKKAYSICSIYIPPSNSLKIEDLNNLKNQLPSPVIFLGDFNAHNPLWGSSYTNTKGTIVENFIFDNDLILYNNKLPTHYDIYHNSSSLIDLTLCQPSVFLDFTCNVFTNNYGSDHYPIQLILNDSEPSDERLYHWNFKKADWKKFRNLCQTNINDDLFIIDSEDMMMYDNDKIRVFTENILDIATESIPKTSKNRKKKTNPWFDKDCKEAIKERDRAHRKNRDSPSDQNKERAQFMRAKCRRTIKFKKRSSWRQYVSSINTNTTIKKVWNKIRKITGKSSNKTLHHVKDKNGNIATSKKEVADALGEQFQKSSSSSNYSTKFQKIKTKEEKRSINFNLSRKDKKSNHFYNKKFKLRDLKWAIRKSNNSTPGPDQIHYEILKHLPETTLKILVKLINECWKTDTFPDSWRQALVIPVPKPDKDLLYPINYRPIALTSCICKVVERMVNERLVWFLDKNNILSRQQYGFRKNRSTVDHLVRLETFIRDAFRHREHVVAVFFDLDKAYDTTWKHGILQDLYRIGLRGNLPKFISIFFIRSHFPSAS